MFNKFTWNPSTCKNFKQTYRKIPVIGNIVIPKDVGEGLFGVSFKMKGPPGKNKDNYKSHKNINPKIYFQL